MRVERNEWMYLATQEAHFLADTRPAACLPESHVWFNPASWLAALL